MNDKEFHRSLTSRKSKFFGNTSNPFYTTGYEGVGISSVTADSPSAGLVTIVADSSVAEIMPGNAVVFSNGVVGVVHSVSGANLVLSGMSGTVTDSETFDNVPFDGLEAIIFREDVTFSALEFDKSLGGSPYLVYDQGSDPLTGVIKKAVVSQGGYEGQMI